ncbi:MAG: acetolactate synthase, large subunit, biosynthetic type [Gammaproteobacteria bacterium TMED226]|nr:MAG: acetolactate synthase, large subunit, biosynthetic type [Gammaproteobacteria bacterium TMED226]|tara:strand:- start:1472 stop:3208 length:1737 start_codon:yes stop_codon:yes gene_type:complete
MKLAGNDILIQSLINEEVEYIFGYPGGAALHIYDSIFKQKEMQHILVRHEQGATHAADGYARATGKPGVVMVTSGPGATNAITGIATAFMDSIPMVVISGQVQSHLIGTDAFQETDMIGISRPIVKHSFTVDHQTNIAQIVKEAFHIATSGRQGPVVIDIPKDITNPDDLFDFQYPSKANIRSYNPPIDPDKSQIGRVVDAILNSKQPVIYAGGGTISSNASEELRELNSYINVPVTNTLMGLGVYPATDEKFLGMLGMHGTYQANMAMHNADLILAIGARFDDRITNTPEKFSPKAQIVHFDVDHSSVSKIIEADIAVFGQVKNSLQAINSLIKDRLDEINNFEIDKWHAQIAEWKKIHGLNHNLYKEESDNNPILPQAVVQHVYHASHGKAFVTSDVGQHQMFTAQYYHFDEPRKWINSGGLGTMGFGLPSAMGVKLAYPDEEVICITGEGSIQMCIQELSTCSQYKLPIKIFNINNLALGMVKQWQDMNYDGRYSSISYEDSLPDFKSLVESYGHIGIKITKNSELKQGIQKAFSIKDKLVFVDIYVDPNEHVYPMLVAPNGSLKDMWLSKGNKT